MPSIPLPTLKWGKKKERSVICEYMTDDGRGVDREVPALISCADDESIGQAYLIDLDNQFFDVQDKTWHQLISEKTQVPICLIKDNQLSDGSNDEKDMEEFSNGIFETAFWQKLTEGVEKAKNTELYNKLMWIVSIICATILIIAGITFIKGG